MGIELDFKINSLSYDVHNKRVQGVLSVTGPGQFASVSFVFPYSAPGHQHEEELKRHMEGEVRKLLQQAAQFT